MEWIKDFNVIYKDELYKNCVHFMPHICGTDNSGFVIERMEIMYIDENGSVKLLEDKAELFKFVRK